MQVSSIFTIISVCLAVGIRSNATASVSVECVCDAVVVVVWCHINGVLACFVGVPPRWAAG